MRTHGRARLAGLGLAIVMLAVACGGNDDDSSSAPTTTNEPAQNVSDPGSSASASIESLQRELNALGCNAGPIDGELGPDTLAAIRLFQSAAGLTVDGIVGPVTSARLAQAAQDGSPNCSGATPPSTSPATTTTGGGGDGVDCSAAAIQAAVQATLTPGETITMSGPFKCAGTWAFNAPTIKSGSQEVEITELLTWNGSAWQTVNRAIYCENGSVPQQIYTDACQSN